MTPRFITLFWRQVVRQAWRHPLLTTLNIASIALGVAVFLAIQIANRSALDSFRSAAELTSAHAHLEIRGDIDETLFPRVVATVGVRHATPLVEGIVPVTSRPGEYLRVLGTDPFSGAEVFAFSLEGPSGQPLDFERWLSDPEALAIQPSIGSPGDSLTVRANGIEQTLTARYVFRPEEFLGTVDPRIAAMDIGWAQELLGRSGRLTSIQVVVEDPENAGPVVDRLRAMLPADIVIEPPAVRDQEMETMLSAFQLNLTAMSMVSLIVGMFLIFNSVGATVVRRRHEIAILRACGATRLEVRALFLGGAALEAITGASLGLALGPILARLASPAMSASISSLYELVRLDHLTLTLPQAAVAFGAGVGAALLAAWAPAAEASRCDPARLLHPGAPLDSATPLRRSGLVFSLILLIAAVGLSYWTLHGGSKLLGFAAAAAVLAGFSLLVPWLTAAVAVSFSHCGRLARLIASHLARSLNRNTVTVAALAAAVAMTISVTVMIHSFRASVERWIGHTLVADLYIAPAENDIVGLQAFLPLEAVAWTKAQPGVVETATFRELPVRFREEPTSLAVIDGKGRGEPEFLPGANPDVKMAFETGAAVVVSESFARRFGVGPGESLPLPTPKGVQNFPIAGIYRDFTRDGGTVMMDRALFQKFWTDERLHSLSLRLTDPAQASTVTEAFQQRFGSDGQYVIYDNSSLRARVFEIFDQTFAVTSILRVIAIIVAVVGVLFSFSVLVIERERETGVLRALGASRWQVMILFLGEAALLGLTASLSGFVSGCALAVVLTGVINKAFFGWTIALTFPVVPLATIPLWLIPAVLFSALIPGWRAAGIRPARAVRFE